MYGQMNEPPGNRLRVALTGLTMAEFFRDEGRDVLMFIDNIYRYTLAGTEVSALLGPHALGGGLPADPGRGDGRAAGAHHLDQDRLDHLVPGGVRARGRPHRPVARHHLRAPRRDASALAADRRARYLPGGRPARLDQPPARPAGRRPTSTTTAARAVQRPCSATRSSRTSSPSWAWTSCPKRTSSPCTERARSSASCRSRSSWRRCSPAPPASTCPLKDTIRELQGDHQRRVRPPARAGVLHGRRHRGGRG